MLALTGARVAALCHDVGHPGRNNVFLINSSHLAVRERRGSRAAGLIEIMTGRVVSVLSILLFVPSCSVYVSHIRVAHMDRIRTYFGFHLRCFPVFLDNTCCRPSFFSIGQNQKVTWRVSRGTRHGQCRRVYGASVPDQLCRSV